jgi:hypothetical protein
MNIFKNYPRCRIWSMVVVLSALTAGCGRDAILGAGGITAVRPFVTAELPLNAATGVPINNTVISVTFNEPVKPLTGAASMTVTCLSPCVDPAGTVTLDATNTVATFTPAAGTPLAAFTQYTGTVSGAQSISAGVSMEAPFSWHFTTGPVLPRVAITSPVTTIPGPTQGVPNNAGITAVFTTDMAPTTVTAANSFTVTCVSPCVTPAGTVTYSVAAKTAVFQPNTVLEVGPTYTATITNAATDLAGSPLAGNQPPLADGSSNYVWTFVAVGTDTTRPRVTTTAPVTTSPGPTPGVTANTGVTAIFSESMAPASISATSFTLTCTACVTLAPPGTVSYSAGAQAAVFVPTSPLEVGVTYTATITTGATDLAKNALEGNQPPQPDGSSSYVWTFVVALPILAGNITVASTSPLDVTTGVCPNASISATFTAPAAGLRIDPTTLNAATFLVTGPGPTFTAVSNSSISLDATTGLVATFTPRGPLQPNLTYTNTIKSGPAGVLDLAALPDTLQSDFVWNFTTGGLGACVLPVTLGSAATFGTFGGSAGTTSSGLLTVVNGDIGTTAASTLVTGFHDTSPGCIYTETPLNVGFVNGLIYTAAPPPTVACPTEGTATTFAVALQARADALAAYNALVALPGGPDPGAGNLANLTLAPGVYTAALGSFMIQGGDLTLDAQGNANAVWVFQMASTLTVGGPGAAFPQSVILTGGAQAKNVFWQVGSAATINAAGGGTTNATMVGTIISQQGADFSTAGNTSILILNGRVLSLNASVTLVDTVINVPAP